MLARLLGRGTELTRDTRTVWWAPNSGSGRQLSTHAIGDALWLCRALKKAGRLLPLWLGASSSSGWGSAAVSSRLLLGEPAFQVPLDRFFWVGQNEAPSWHGPWSSCQGEEPPVARGGLTPVIRTVHVYGHSCYARPWLGVDYLALFCNSFI